jgi:hypothetical protein
VKSGKKMNERRQQIERIFLAVRELDKSSQPEFMMNSCAEDSALRRKTSERRHDATLDPRPSHPDGYIFDKGSHLALFPRSLIEQSAGCTENCIGKSPLEVISKPSVRRS